MATIKVCDACEEPINDGAGYCLRVGVAPDGVPAAVETKDCCSYACVAAILDEKHTYYDGLVGQ